MFYANQNHNLFALCDLIHAWARFELEEIDGTAALFFAAKKGYGWVVNQLLYKGLDANITDDEGKTAVFYANQNNNISVLCYLIQKGARFELEEIDGKAALFTAAKEGFSVVVDKLLSKGLDVNITDDEGKTALFYAGYNNDIPVLCNLIQAGARFELGEIYGDAVLLYAAECDYSVVISFLASKFLDVNITDNEGKTPVFYANLNYSFDALCELISCGAKIDGEEIDVESTLFYAAKNNYYEILYPLWRAGVDLNMADYEGKTIVFHSDEKFLNALKHYDEVLVNKRDIKGRTALFYAFRDMLPDKVQRLMEMGGNCELRDNCNVNIFSFFVEECILKDVGALKLFSHDIFQKQRHLNALTQAIFDVVCSSSSSVVRSFSYIFV